MHLIRHTATVFGVPLAYWRSASPAGSPVLYLHGLGADHTGLLELAAAIPGTDVILPDLPGFGESPALPVTHSLAHYCRAIEALRVQLGLDSFTLVGHSLGANVALAYAGMHGQRLRGLALLHPVTQGRGPLAWLGRAYYRTAVLMPAVLARLWLTSRPLVYLSDLVVLTTRDRERRRSILQSDYRTAAMASPRAIGEVYASFARTPFNDLCAQITVPTLVVTGSRDALARPAAIADIHRRIPGSTVSVIDGAGHLWPAELPHEAASLVARVLFAPSAAPASGAAPSAG